MILFKRKKAEGPATSRHDDLPDLPPLPPLAMHGEDKNVRSAPLPEARREPAKPMFPEHEPFIPERHEAPRKEEREEDYGRPHDLTVSPLLKREIKMPQKLERNEVPKPEKSMLPDLKKIAQESKEEEKKESGWRKVKMEKEDDFMEAKREMPEQRPVIREAPISSKARVFVRLDKYNEIIRTVNSIENKINDLQNTIRRINDIKSKEKEIIDGWDELLTATKNTISDVNARLPGPEEY